MDSATLVQILDPALYTFLIVLIPMNPSILPPAMLK